MVEKLPLLRKALCLDLIKEKINLTEQLKSVTQMYQKIYMSFDKMGKSCDYIRVQ